jgi:hypothetical protein
MTNSIYNTLHIEEILWNNGASLSFASNSKKKTDSDPPYRVSQDDSIWSYRMLNKANRVWVCIPEENLPRYAALDIKKGNPIHPIKYLIMLAARTYLERYEGRLS